MAHGEDTIVVLSVTDSESNSVDSEKRDNLHVYGIHVRTPSRTRSHSEESLRHAHRSHISHTYQLSSRSTAGVECTAVEISQQVGDLAL